LFLAFQGSKCNYSSLMGKREGGSKLSMLASGGKLSFDNPTAAPDHLILLDMP
jgi:hypothetical protein